jgi:hypothetical protein
VGEEMTVKIGDWVRFHRCGVLVIGEVAYLRPSPLQAREMEVVTDHGVCNLSDVLEVRAHPLSVTEEK